MQPPSPSSLLSLPLLASLLSLLPSPCAPDLLITSSPTSSSSLEAAASSFDSSSENNFNNPFNPNQPNFPFVSSPSPDILIDSLSSDTLVDSPFSDILLDPSPNKQYLASSSLFPPPYSDYDTTSLENHNLNDNNYVNHNNNINHNNSNTNLTDYDDMHYNEVIPMFRDYSSLHDSVEAEQYAFGDKVDFNTDDNNYSDYVEEVIVDENSIAKDNMDIDGGEEDLLDMAYESSRQLAKHVLALDLGYHIQQGAFLSHQHDMINDHFMGSGKFNSSQNFHIFGLKSVWFPFNLAPYKS